MRDECKTDSAPDKSNICTEADEPSERPRVAFRTKASKD